MESKMVEPVAPFFSEDPVPDEALRHYAKPSEEELKSFFIKGRDIQQDLWDAGKPNRAVEKELSFVLR